MSDTFSFYALVDGAVFCVSQEGDTVSAMQVIERTDTKERRGVNLCSEKHPNLLVGKRLVSYMPREGNRDPLKVIGGNWGPSSPPVIALFPRPEYALEAFNTGFRHSLPSWEESTRRVARMLGTNCDRIWILMDQKSGLLTELEIAA